MTTDGIARFLMSADDVALVSREFRFLAHAVVLHAMNPSTLSALPEQSGCYFWVMQVEGRAYKIYLGRTRSIRKRVSDYAIPFQLHSPNDYKLQFFQDLMSETHPGGQLDLYFMPVAGEELKARETELVQLFKPLVNTLPASSPLERQRVREAFAEYYRSVITRHIS